MKPHEECTDTHPEANAGEPVDDGWDPPVQVLDPNCPTCQLGPGRQTVGMVCQTCGTDYAPAAHQEVTDGGLDSGAVPGEPAN